VFTLILGLFRFGFLDNVFARYVLRGFLFASAFIVIVEQLPTVLSIELHHGTTVEKVGHILKHLDKANGPTVGISILSITILLFLKYNHVVFPPRAQKYLIYFPGPIIVVTLGLIFAYSFDLERHGVALLGKIEAGFPTP